MVSFTLLEPSGQVVPKAFFFSESGQKYELWAGIRVGGFSVGWNKHFLSRLAADVTLRQNVARPTVS